MEEQPKTLEINAVESVKADERFGKMTPEAMQKLQKSIAGTLHLVREEDKTSYVNSAWQLSKDSGKPVVIVVRAS